MSSGPMSDTVARTGCPAAPKTSQNTTGDARQRGSVPPVRLSRSVSFADDDPGRREPGEIAFDVGHERRHAEPREVLGHHLQRDGLAGAGRAGDQPMTIRQGGTHRDLHARRGAGDDKRLGHGHHSNSASDSPIFQFEDLEIWGPGDLGIWRFRASFQSVARRTVGAQFSADSSAVHARTSRALHSGPRVLFTPGLQAQFTPVYAGQLVSRSLSVSAYLDRASAFAALAV